MMVNYLLIFFKGHFMKCKNCGHDGEGNRCLYCGEKYSVWAKLFKRHNGSAVSSEKIAGYKNGIRIEIHPIGTDEKDVEFLIVDGVKYSLNDVKSVESIPVPTYEPQNTSFPAVTEQLEYFLHKKAGWLDKQGKQELAIACTLKAICMYPTSGIGYGKEHYMKPVKLLYKYGRFEDAEAMKANIEKTYGGYYMDVNDTDAAAKLVKEFADIYGDSDLLITSATPMSCVCAECAPYANRVFSVFGNDKRYPKLPEHLRSLRTHEGCSLCFDSFVSGVCNFASCSPKYDYVDDDEQEIIRISNRPYIDERTDEEKMYFRQHIEELADQKAKERDYEIYYRLVYVLPDDIPKSFSAYRRMKKANTENFLKLVKKAKTIGIDIV